MKPFPFAIYPGEKNKFQLNTFRKSIPIDFSKIFEGFKATDWPKDPRFRPITPDNLGNSLVQKTIESVRNGISSGMIIPWEINQQTFGPLNLSPEIFAQLYGVRPGQAPIVSASGRDLIQLNHQYIDEGGNKQSIPLRFYRSTGQAGKVNIPAGKWYFAPVTGEDDWIGKYTAHDSGKSAEEMAEIPISQRKQNGMENSYGNPVIAFYKKWLDDNIGNIGNTSQISGADDVTQNIFTRMFSVTQNGIDGFNSGDLSHNSHLAKMFPQIRQQIGKLLSSEGIDPTLGKVFSYYHDILNNRKAVSPEVDQYRIPGSTHSGYGISSRKMNDMDPRVFPALSRFLAQSEQSQPAPQINPLEEQLKDATRDFYSKKYNYMRSLSPEDSEKFRAAQKTLLDTFPKAKDTEFGKNLRAYTEVARKVPSGAQYTPEQVSLLTPHIEKIGSALFPKTWKMSSSFTPHEEKIGAMHAHLPPSVEKDS